MRQIETSTRRTVLKTVGGSVVGGVVLSGSASGAGNGPLKRSLAEVRSATARYNDSDNAVADGYVRETHPVCGMGYHFAHRDFVAAIQTGDPEKIAAYLASLDRTEPPVLAYGEGDDGLVLGAVEYLTVDDSEDLFPSTEKDHWHPFFGPLYSLHAWVHSPNPEGVFHPTNPRPQFTKPEWCEQEGGQH